MNKASALDTSAFDTFAEVLIAYASPRTDAPALIARKGTAPHKSAAQGAEPGLESEWAMYKYPAVAVNKPIAVELRVRRSLINVSIH
jgi:hypothetical protein